MFERRKHLWHNIDLFILSKGVSLILSYYIIIWRVGSDYIVNAMSLLCIVFVCIIQVHIPQKLNLVPKSVNFQYIYISTRIHLYIHIYIHLCKDCDFFFLGFQIVLAPDFALSLWFLQKIYFKICISNFSYSLCLFNS